MKTGGHSRQEISQRLYVGEEAPHPVECPESRSKARQRILRRWYTRQWRSLPSFTPSTSSSCLSSPFFRLVSLLLLLSILLLHIGVELAPPHFWTPAAQLKGSTSKETVTPGIPGNLGVRPSEIPAPNMSSCSEGVGKPAVQKRGRKQKRVRFKRALMEGPGLAGATLLEKTCFSIKAYDRSGLPMDASCRPKTFWKVFLRSKNNEVQLAADVSHNASSGEHLACYTITTPGKYNLTAQIEFENADEITSRQLSVTELLYSRELVVAKASLVVTPGDEKKRLAWSNRPFCTMRQLAESRNRGQWNGPFWSPLACRPLELTPRQIGKCLDGKSLLLVGDSQMRYTFAQWMHYMGGEDRQLYLRTVLNRSLAVAVLKIFNQKFKPGKVPLRNSGTVFKSQTRYGRSVNISYFGSGWNGFGIANVTALDPVTNRIEAQFNVTYVAHMVASDSLFQAWMLDNGTLGEGEAVANHGAPFDAALVTTGLHDLHRFASTADFAAALRSHMVPSVLSAVRRPDDVTWAGIWAAQLATKPARFRPTSNNARGFAFEAAARRTLGELGIDRWLDMRYMTSPRSDLCKDSTHYSWPISLATIDLWLGSICSTPPAHPGRGSRKLSGR